MAAILILAAIVLVLLVALAFSRAAVRRGVELEAGRLADAMAREAKAAAERKAAATADAAVEEIKEASHEKLAELARDLARRN